MGAGNPVQVPRSQQLTLHSPATGRDYLIQISMPEEPPPPSGYSVLYVLDGNAYWPLLRTAHLMFSRRGPHAQPEPLLIVGIGYPGGQRFDYTARAEDYTPYVPNAGRQRGNREYGGAERFLTFIRKQLKPAVNARYAVNKDAQAIIGHSFGGLFVMYTLLARPDTFDRYLAISPSLWWGQGNLRYYLDRAEQAKVEENKDLSPSCLFIGLGSQERRGRKTTDHDRHGRGANMPEYARRLTHHLHRLYPQLNHKLAIFPGEHHGTVMWPAARRALAFLHRCSPNEDLD